MIRPIPPMTIDERSVLQLLRNSYTTDPEVRWNIDEIATVLGATGVSSERTTTAVESLISTSHVLRHEGSPELYSAEPP
jgi:hypothetical protein